MKIMRRGKKRPGSPPGTLVFVGEETVERVAISLIDYNRDSLTEKEIENISDLETCIHRNTVSWININGLHDIRIMEEIGRIFGVHPLILEDILNTDHRPKFEEHDDYYYIILKMLTYDREQRSLVTEQVSIILGSNYVLTFQEREGDVFDVIRERLRKNRGRLRKEGEDYLLYTLMDAVVDYYFVVLESITGDTENLEDRLLNSPTPATLQKIHDLKRELIFMRKSVWPLREILSGLVRTESERIRESSRMFFRDVYDHTIQIMDTVETLRDIVSGMLDVYLSTVSNRMNEVMKVLTIIATIFIPLTFIAGVYGMNFQFMPELDWKLGYPIVLGIMVLVGLVMLLFFKRRKWI